MIGCICLKLHDVVADPRLAELTEVGKVFTELSGIDAGLLLHVRRGDRLHLGRFQIDQVAQIGREALQGGDRDLWAAVH